MDSDFLKIGLCVIIFSILSSMHSLPASTTPWAIKLRTKFIVKLFVLRIGSLLQGAKTEVKKINLLQIFMTLICIEFPNRYD